MKNNTVSIHSLIGYKTKFWGDLETDGFLRIDGFFSGRILSNGKIVIGKNGIGKKCTIIAKYIIIGGKIEGDIYSDNRVEILKSAEIYGNIYSNFINIEDNISFKGMCHILPKKEIEELLKKIKNK